MKQKLGILNIKFFLARWTKKKEIQILEFIEFILEIEEGIFYENKKHCK